MDQLISIVVPVFNEQDNIEKFYNAVSEELAGYPEYHWELIFVDDGSTDRSAEVLKSLHGRGKSVFSVMLSRNFGSHGAVMAGLNCCRGGAAVIISVDLQDPVSTIPQFIESWMRGHLVVWGVRNQRSDEGVFSRYAAKAYYYLVGKLCGIQIPEHGVDCVLIDRKVINELLLSKDVHAPFTMMISWCGYKSSSITFNRKDREVGSSKWSFARRFKLAIDSFVGFSYLPIRIISAMGIITSTFGFLYGSVVFVRGLGGYAIEGWTSLMVVTLMLGGIQMLILGVLGEYLWRGLEAIKGRPRYLIAESTVPEFKT